MFGFNSHGILSTSIDQRDGRQEKKPEPPEPPAEGGLLNASVNVTGVEMAAWARREQKTLTVLNVCAIFRMKAERKDNLCSF